MVQSRWIYLAAGLAVAFIASVAGGAWIGRQRAPAPPVSVTATPTPVVATATPVVTATPSAAATPVPPTPVPPTPAAAPTATPETLTAEGFALELAAALSASDAEYLYDHLHPATLERYGEQACRAYIAGIEGEFHWEIPGSSGPGDWAYETDGLTTLIEDAWTVTIRQRGADPEMRDVHYAPSEGIWRWFTDCGEPA